MCKGKLNEELIAFAEAWSHLKKRTFEEMHQDKNESDHAEEFFFLR